MISGVPPADMPAGVERKLWSAALLGARRVMFVMFAKLATSSGCVARMPRIV